MIPHYVCMFVCRTCPCVWCLNFSMFCLRSQVGIAGGNSSKKILEIIIIFRSRIYPKDQKRLTDLDFRLDFLFFEKIQSYVEFMQNSDWETNNNKYAQISRLVQSALFLKIASFPRKNEIIVSGHTWIAKYRHKKIKTSKVSSQPK